MGVQKMGEEFPRRFVFHELKSHGLQTLERIVDGCNGMKHRLDDSGRPPAVRRTRLPRWQADETSSLKLAQQGARRDVFELPGVIDPLPAASNLS